MIPASGQAISLDFGFPYWLITVPVRGGYVIRVEELSELYELGRAVGPFETLLSNFPGITPYRMMWAAGFLQATLGHVVKDEILPFKQTKKAAAQLKDLIDTIFRERANSPSFDQPFTPIETQQLTDAASELTLAMRYEVDTMPVFFVPEQRAYSTEALLNKAEEVLGQSQIELLADRTIFDIREAGRCIAFGVPTAAGFHSVRAVEAVARGYHEILTGVRPGAETPLGPLINGLRTKRDALLASKAIDKEDRLNLAIDFLGRINNVYRKPITHPEMILESSQGITVFDAAKCAIDLILEDAPMKSTAPIPKRFF